MNMGGFRIATIRGIPIRIHFTFLLVLPFIAFGFARVFRSAAAVAGVPADQLVSPWVWGLGLAVALFASVLVHELAHSLYALAKGGRVRDITLLMIGGVSQMSEPPREARHEAAMAAIGPAASLALGGLFWGLHAIADSASFNLRFGLFYLGNLNLFLGLFNLLPAFPMDGGRVLRAVLVRRLGVVRATKIASRVGKAFAIAFGVWGFIDFNMLLLLIAFFVYLGAEGEARSVVVQTLLGRLRVRDLMDRRVFSVPAEASVQDVTERMLREQRFAYVAIVDSQTIGLVTLDAVRAIPAERRAEMPAWSIAVQVPPLSPDEEASRAMRIMSETDTAYLAVAEDGRLVGIISRDDIARGLALSELEASQLGRAGAFPLRREELRV